MLPTDTSWRWLCEGFFHVDRCYEWGQGTLCLVQPRCFRYVVRGVCSLELLGQPLFLRAYENVHLGSTRDNLHVEDVMTQDPELLAALELVKQQIPVTGLARLTLWITYQPCHHSSGGRNLQGQHDKSCTRVLLDFVRRVLRPAGTELRIKCFGLYRVQWEDEALFREGDADKFQGRLSLASQGLEQLLYCPGVSLSVVTDQDWAEFLALARQPELRGPDFFPETSVAAACWDTRRAFEARCRDFLARFRESTSFRHACILCGNNGPRHEFRACAQFAAAKTACCPAYYAAPSLRPDEQLGFCAAGLAVYTRLGPEFLFLMVAQERQGHKRFNFMAGKRETLPDRLETASETALREFNEECEEFAVHRDLATLVCLSFGAAVWLWCPRAKMALAFVEVSGDMAHSFAHGLDCGQAAWVPASSSEVHQFCAEILGQAVDLLGLA